MSKLSELREMSDEQLGLTLKDAVENLFRLRIKSQTEKLDYEGELCAVVGRRCAADGTADSSVVAAWTAGNDVSARDVQFADVQWTRGKSFDTFAPMGPWLVTSDELGDIADVRITTLVNGEKLQDDVAGSMVFDVDAILRHLHAVVTTGRAWDPEIATHGTKTKPVPLAA